MLLRMLGQRQLQNGLHALSSKEWQKVLEIAGQHRLLPLLHARLERGQIKTEVPGEVRDLLRASHRDSALLALVHRTEMFAAADILRSSGIESVALKGAWLAWYAYPAAAERPMRDIDLLLKPDQALDAFHLLREHGFVQSAPSILPAEEMGQSAKHLPPITSPTGVEFELHTSCWEPPGYGEWPMPPLMDVRIFAEAVAGGPGDPCFYPKPNHMLIHLVIHAAYSHRFDVGPLILSDIGFLIGKHPIDWHNFWRDAQAGGYAQGAALVLNLAERWVNNGQIGWRGGPQSPPQDLLEDCEKLLVQDLSQRKNVGAAAAIIDAKDEGGLSGMLARLRAKVSGGQRETYASGDKKSASYLAWLLRRSASFATSMAAPEPRETAARKSRIGRYLS